MYYSDIRIAAEVYVETYRYSRYIEEQPARVIGGEYSFNLRGEDVEFEIETIEYSNL